MALPGLVVFDLDGTLIDSRRDLAAAANAMLARFGCEALPESAVTAMVGEGARMLVARAFEARGVRPAPDGALERFLEAYQARLVIHTSTYEGVGEVLSTLAPRCRLALLTNKPQRPAEALLAHFGLARFFDRVIGGDGPFARKPDPAGLTFLASEASVSAADTLLVGDSWIDRETARRAGTRACVARYGFGFAPTPPDWLSGDELIIDAPRELLVRLGVS